MSKRGTSKRAKATKKVSPALSELLKRTQILAPKFDTNKWFTATVEIDKILSDIYSEIDEFKAIIAEEPFLSLIMLWSHEIEGIQYLSDRYFAKMTDLLEGQLLPYMTKDGDNLLTVEQFAEISHEEIFDKIRSNKKWTIDEREEYAEFYLEFATLLKEFTFGLISAPVDPDRAITLKRRLPFKTYVRIIKELADRERILAKIFYLGGSRSLEEVLSLKIEDLNLDENSLKFAGQSVTYPRHVLEDLLDYVAKRKKGYVFVGRDGERIDHTVPYRALKNVASKLHLDQSFTFKDFVKNL